MKHKKMIVAGGKGIAFALALAAGSGWAGSTSGGESVGDFVWEDLNMDGIQDADEPGLPGVTVKLFAGTSEIATTTTDEYGNYRFIGIQRGQTVDWKVGFTLLDGFVFTLLNQGGDDTKDSDADPMTGLTHAVNFYYTGQDQYDSSLDAGMYRAVPAPAAVWLFGSALLGLGALRRNARR